MLERVKQEKGAGEEDMKMEGDPESNAAEMITPASSELQSIIRMAGKVGKMGD